MSTEVPSERDFYVVSVRGPNGEEEKITVTGDDSAATLKQKASISAKFNIYTTYHFEVENLTGGEDLLLDPYEPFSTIPVIGNGTTILLVPDMYDANTIRYQIKHSVALLTNKFPLISQLVKLNNDALPASLDEYNEAKKQVEKQMEEKKEVEKFQLKERIDADMKVSDADFTVASTQVSLETNSRNVEAFARLYNSVNEALPVSIKSLSLSSYNPPKSNRKALGDLIYLRMSTSENIVFHITGNAEGFFANKSTDSVFNPAENDDYSTIYPTLPAVLCSLSSGFKKWYQKSRAVGRSSDMNSIIRSLPVMPNLISSKAGWFDSMKDNGNLFDYADVIMDDGAPVAMLNTTEAHQWLNDYNILRESTLSTELRSSLVISKEQSFAIAATRASRAIVDEGLPSLFINKDTEPCYVVDDIFLTSIAAGDSDVVTSADCNDEVTSTRFINGLQLKGLYTGLTAVIDYKGRRFLAQSAIPGIMNVSALNMVMWGSVDDGHTIFHDDRVRPFIDSMADKFYWTPSHVIAQPVTDVLEPTVSLLGEEVASTAFSCDETTSMEFMGPVEGRIVRGTDNRVYAVDFLHTTPVDVMWSEEHKTMFPEAKVVTPTLRRQMVVQWIVSRMMLQQRAEALREALSKLEKGESVEGVENTAESVQRLTEAADALEKEILTTAEKFDVNAFTRFSPSGCEGEEDVRALGVMLREKIISAITRSIVENIEFFADTETLVSTLHASGVNARYLGMIAVKSDNIRLRELCEQEMVARAAKHVLKSILSSDVLQAAAAFVVTAFLNSVICREPSKEILLSGKNKKSRKVPSQVAQALVKQGLTSSRVWELIKEDVKTSFHYELTLWGKNAVSADKRFRLLRRVCLQCGVCLQAEEYNLDEDYVIRVENIMAFVPHVKFANTPTVDENCSELYQSIMSLVQDARFAEAYDLSKRVLLQLISAHSMLHPQLLSLLNVMSLILSSVNDFKGAAEMTRAALYCADVVNGKDSLESAKLHSQLGSLLFKNECYLEATAHNTLALMVYRQVGGDDCERVKLLCLNLGMCYMQAQQPEKALKCFEKSMMMENRKSDDYTNACFYACVLYAAQKMSADSERCRALLVESISEQSEEFRNKLMENLTKQLKDLH